MKNTRLRAIPAVEKVLQSLGEIELPRRLVVEAVRRELAGLRGEKKIPSFDSILERVRLALEELRRSRIQPVTNGTGIIVHTNLGRAPLGAAEIETLQSVARNYNNLEFDLGNGERGVRGGYVERGLALLCEAEAATVANNCAAALVLILRHFTGGQKKKVVVSRGELVQIGGGFRIPEILEASGAQLREVGTTNKTSIQDYARAIDAGTALILRVHRSNFFMGGFVESPATAELAALARRKRVPFVEDLGSGAMIATEKITAAEHEPTPAEILQHGVDLVCFSGDKLFGGPQAGIIAGRARYITALKREPFFRALRCDKLILAALQTTVENYLQNTVVSAIPVMAMWQAGIDELRARAGRILAAVQHLDVVARLGEGRSQMGGGTLPRSFVPSITTDLQPNDFGVDELARRLRGARPAIIGYLAGGKFRLDLRTVFSGQDEEICRALKRALTA